MVDVAQSVRVTDCGSEGRGFESHLPPLKAGCEVLPRIFFLFVSEFVSQLPLLSKQKSRTACTCFQQCNMGKVRVTSVVYLRTAHCATTALPR